VRGVAWLLGAAKACAEAVLGLRTLWYAQRSLAGHLPGSTGASWPGSKSRKQALITTALCMQHYAVFHSSSATQPLSMRRRPSAPAHLAQHGQPHGQLARPRACPALRPDALLFRHGRSSRRGWRRGRCSRRAAARHAWRRRGHAAGAGWHAWLGWQHRGRSPGCCLSARCCYHSSLQRAGRGCGCARGQLHRRTQCDSSSGLRCCCHDHRCHEGA
jgi:hypothetical protein